MAIPSKKSASKKSAPAPAGKKGKKPLFALGDHVKFIGYSSLEPGDDEIIVRPDVFVLIESEPVLDENGKFKYTASVLSTDEEDLDENGDLPADTLFEDELAELTADEESEAQDIAEAIEAANDEDTLILHGRAADEDETSKEGKAGVKAIKAACKEQGINSDDYDSWEDTAIALLNPEPDAEPEPEADAEGEETNDDLVQVTQEEMDELIADAEAADADPDTGEGKKADKRLAAFFKKHDVDVEEAGSWTEAVEDNVEVADDEEAPKGKAKKKAAAPKAGKEDAEEAPLVLTATVKKALKAGDAHAAAIEIKARGDQAYFDLACILTHIRKNKLHTSMKDDEGVNYEDSKEGFGAYVEQQFQMALPTAYHWMRIYAAVSALGKGGADLAGIGWDKAIYIALAIKSTGFDMEDDEFAALMEFAVNNDRKTLANHVRVDYIDVAADGEDGGGDSKAKRLAKQKEKKVTRRFVVFGDQANSIIDEAISAAKEAIGTDDDSLGLVQVCTEWAQLQDMEIPVEQAIEALEARYGITLTVETPAPAASKGKAKQAAPAKKVVTRKK